MRGGRQTLIGNRARAARSPEAARTAALPISSFCPVFSGAFTVRFVTFSPSSGGHCSSPTRRSCAVFSRELGWMARRGDPRGPSNAHVPNQTHASTTDPDARLAGMKGQGARLAYQGHVVTENRNGLVVAAKLTQASGDAEREAALEMVQGLGGARRITLGGDKGYDAKSFVQALRAWSVTPHVAQNTTKRRSAIDRRTTGHPDYEVSQRFRKRVEEVFGWMKTVGLMRKTRHRGTDRVGWVFTFTAAAYNLVRIRNLLEAT